MTLHKTHLLAPILLISSLLTSCKKDDSLSNSSIIGTGISFQLKATNPFTTVNQIAVNTSSTSLRVTATDIQWISGVATASLIKFEAKKGVTEVEFKSALQQTIDLFGNNAAFGSITIPPGTYSEVEFKAQLNPSSSAPALELKGKIANGATSTNIIFRATEMIEIKGEKTNITIDNSTVYSAITSLDLSRIAQGISAASLSGAVLTGGDVLITSSINKNLYDIIVNNLRNLNDEEDFH